ncbi:MAG: ROK family protein [Bifidobacteriaceae bacterium]|jgi:glucokinase|nr:ROK family protein [Bifidobacteriaceae bacterium]
MLTPALDLGGTLIKGALVDPSGGIVHRATCPTGAADGHLAVVGRVAELGRELLAEAADRNRQAAPALGVSIPGLVDVGRGLALKAANLDWEDFPVRAALAERVGAQVEICHDVAGAAWAEHKLGAARGAEVAVVVVIGTGLAGALINRDQAVVGAHGLVIEAGHLPLAWSDEVCGCGGGGCVERVASASALVARYTRLAGAEAGLDAKEVVRRAQTGDAAARQVWSEAVRALGDCLATLVTVLDPDRIVVGGGLAQAGETLLAPVRARLSQCLRPFQTMPEVVQAKLGSDAGVIGAALAAGL